MSAPRVLVTNDDGPPGETSPFIYGFVEALVARLGWRVRVVIPSGQKSWIGKAYHIKETVAGEYFYPKAPAGLEGERHPTRRDGENDSWSDAWVLLDGTPATCANVALHNLYAGEIDLCISGPNYGRNTSSAFALSSGTVGAAMSAATSGCPAIALSYGIFQKPVDDAIVARAHELAVDVVEQLWRGGFPTRKGEHEAGLCYTVNIPLLPQLVGAEVPIRWTTLAERSYARLFAPVASSSSSSDQRQAKDAGPASVPPTHQGDDAAPLEPAERYRIAPGARISVKFRPDLGALVAPDAASLVAGTDIHAITHCAVSVTPLRATFAAADVPVVPAADARGRWKL